MGRIHEIKIEKNEDIKRIINDFVIEKGWKNSYISGAIGSVCDVEFTAPIARELPPVIGTAICPGPGELLAFTGEIMERSSMDPILSAAYPDSESSLFIHIHASVAVSGGHVYGGGFRKGNAFRGVKVYIQEQD